MAYPCNVLHCELLGACIDHHYVAKGMCGSITFCSELEDVVSHLNSLFTVVTLTLSVTLGV